MAEVGIADFLVIAEAVTGVDAHTLKRITRLSEAESALAAPHASFRGHDFYPDPAKRAAILCSRIVRNHPLPDGNKRVGLLCMLIALDRNGLRWKPAGRLETAEMIERLAARDLSEPDWVAWVRSQVEPVQ